MKIEKVNFPSMKKSALILILNVLLLQSCGTSGSGDTAQAPEPQPTPPPANPGAVTTNPTQPQANQTETSDMLGQAGATQTKSNSVAPRGLIPSIKPQSRQNQSPKGRTDPFGLIGVKTVVNNPSSIPSPGTPKQGSVTKGGVAKGGVAKGGVAKGGIIKPPTVTLGQDAGGQGSYCKRSSDPGSVAFVPPEPTEARSVLVSGIINTQDRILAIVKTSDYEYSYSIGEGATLYGGQVFVKSINPVGKKPYVTLEQYGQEVIRVVGDIPEKTDEKSEKDKGLQIITPKGPEVFGLVNGLMLTKINLKQDPISNSSRVQRQFSASVSGTLCNDSNKVLNIQNMVLQIEDTKGIVLDSQDVDLGRVGRRGRVLGFVLKPGQSAEFDTDIQLRNRLGGEVNIKLREWY